MIKKPTQNDKKLTLFVLAFTLLTIIGLGIFLGVDLSVPPKIEISGSTVHIKDTYSKKIELGGAEISMKNDPLAIRTKNNGTSAKNLRKGMFSLEGEEGTVYLSLMNKNAEYILILSGGERYYINRENDEATEALYRQMIEAAS